MKLIVDISPYYDSESKTRLFWCGAYFEASSEDDMVQHDNFSQAREVAQLTEIAAEIESVVKAYNSKDLASKPIVLIKSSTEPLTE